MPSNVTPLKLFSQTAIGLFAVAALAGCPAKLPGSADGPKAPALPGSKKKTDTPTPTLEQILSIYDVADNLSVDAKNRCAIDICGPTSSADFRDALASAPVDGGRDLMVQLTPLIQKYLDQDIKGSKFTVDLFNERKSKLGQVKLSPKYLSFLNVEWIFNKVYDKVTGALESSLPYTLNMAKLKTIMAADPELAHENPEFIKHAVETVLNSSELADAGTISNYGMDGFASQHIATAKIVLADRLKQLGLENPTQQQLKNLLIQDFAEKLKEKVEAFAKEFPNLPFQTDPALIALAQGKDIQADEADRISDAISLSLFAKLIFNSDGLFAKRKVDVKSALARFERTRVPKMQKEIATGSIAGEKQIVDACRLTTDQIAAAGLTADALTNAKPMIETVRRLALEEVAKMRVSPEAEAALTEKISQIGFAFPPTTERRMEKLIEDMKENLAQSERTEAWVTKASDEELAFLFSMSDSQDKPQFAKYCEERRPQPVADYSLTALGEVSVGWETLMNPEIGYGILSHELGHIVSSIVSGLQSKKGDYDLSAYDSMRSCLDGRHGIQYGRTASTEEDYADLFSAQLMKRIPNLYRKQGNMGCLLLAHDDYRYGVRAGLTLMPPYGATDVHSTDFYRVVQQELDLGRSLPASCQTLVDSTLPSMKRICF